MILNGPSPHGEGGLKCQLHVDPSRDVVSLPTRGGWIEITAGPGSPLGLPSPSSRGEGGLKFTTLVDALDMQGPSPHGEGGLKFLLTQHSFQTSGPSPHREGGLKFGKHTLKTGGTTGPSPHGEGGLKFLYLAIPLSRNHSLCSSPPLQEAQSKIK